MTIPPGTLDLVIYQGSVLNEVFTIEDVDANGVATLVNLTGYTARMQAREYFSAATAFIDLTTENGGISINGAAGTVTLTMSATATAAITVQAGVWGLELIPSSGAANALRVLEGSVTISREAAR